MRGLRKVLVCLMVTLMVPGIVEADWLVRSTRDPQKLQALQAAGLRRAHSYRNFPWTIYRGSPSAEEKFSHSSLAKELSAEPDLQISLALNPVDPFYVSQNFFHPLQPDADIHIREAWDIQTDASSIVVAVIDSGIDINHVDLRDNLWINQAEADGQIGVDDDNNGFIDDINGWNPFDQNGDLTDGLDHGTGVSGVIGARGNNGIGVAGTTWSVQIMTIRSFASQTTDLTKILDGIDYLLEFPAVRILNASWAETEFSQALLDALEEVAEREILLVAAAGNGDNNVGLNLDEIPFYPASFELDNLVTVGAISLMGSMSVFSNFGSAVTLVAPGESVFTTIPSTPPPSGDPYDACWGTSFSTPIVTGVAALLLAREPALTPAQLRQRFISSSRRTPDLEAIPLGGYLLDAERFLSAPINGAHHWTCYR